MTDHVSMDRVYVLAEKMNQGLPLDIEEEMFYASLQKDEEAYQRFAIYTAMMDAIFFKEKEKEENYFQK